MYGWLGFNKNCKHKYDNQELCRAFIKIAFCRFGKNCRIVIFYHKNKLRNTAISHTNIPSEKINEVKQKCNFSRNQLNNVLQ